MDSTIKPQGSDHYFDLLASPQFYSQGPIWQKKEQCMPCKNLKDRFQFYKIGKTFGMFTQRMLAAQDGKLFYYESERSEQTKGYCSVRNLYCGFFASTEKYPYLIKLTNYNSISEIYIQDKDQFQQLKVLLAKYCVQINFDEEFKLVEKIGEGSFSKVYVAKKKEGSVYAVKILKKFDSNSIGTLEAVKQEKAVLEMCSSDYCSRYYQFYEDAHHYYLVLEYIQGKSLMDIAKEHILLEMDKKASILKGILQALEYIHSKGVIDRDVKPQNIIVNLETHKPKLIDFGLALVIGQDNPIQDFKRCGTMGYIPPEIMKSVQSNRIRYSEKVDIFSFGIVAHILILGFNPLKGKTYQQTFQKNKDFDIRLDIKALNQQHGEYCGQFLKGLLESNASDRLSAKQALQHPFLNSNHSQQKKQVIASTRKWSINFEQEYARTRHESPRKKPVRQQ